MLHLSDVIPFGYACISNVLYYSATLKLHRTLIFITGQDKPFTMFCMHFKASPF